MMFMQIYMMMQTRTYGEWSAYGECRYMYKHIYMCVTRAIWEKNIIKSPNLCHTITDVRKGISVYFRCVKCTFALTCDNSFSKAGKKQLYWLCMRTKWPIWIWETLYVMSCTNFFCQSGWKASYYWTENWSR